MVGGAREKFGLSWLNPDAPRAGGDVQTNAAQASRISQQVDAALFSVGVKVVSKLNSAPDKTAGFNELANKTGVSINQLIPVINHLAELGWVQYVENDKIKLTAEGTAQVS